MKAPGRAGAGAAGCEGLRHDWRCCHCPGTASGVCASRPRPRGVAVHCKHPAARVRPRGAAVAHGLLLVLRRAAACHGVTLRCIIHHPAARVRACVPASPHCSGLPAEHSAAIARSLPLARAPCTRGRRVLPPPASTPRRACVLVCLPALRSSTRWRTATVPHPLKLPKGTLRPTAHTPQVAPEMVRVQGRVLAPPKVRARPPGRAVVAGGVHAGCVAPAACTRGLSLLVLAMWLLPLRRGRGLTRCDDEPVGAAQGQL